MYSEICWKLLKFWIKKILSQDYKNTTSETFSYIHLTVTETILPIFCIFAFIYLELQYCIKYKAIAYV